MLLQRSGSHEGPCAGCCWYQKAADLGDAPSKATLGALLCDCNPRAGVAKDAARGSALVRLAFAEGYSPALFHVARCYLRGEGVEKDAAQGVSLLRQGHQPRRPMKPKAETALAICYMEGNGVEADAVQAALWCHQAAESGDAQAIALLPTIRTCSFCFPRPARKHCERCRKVRYCDAECQRDDPLEPRGRPAQEPLPPPRHRGVSAGAGRRFHVLAVGDHGNHADVRLMRPIIRLPAV